MCKAPIHNPCGTGGAAASEDAGPLVSKRILRQTGFHQPMNHLSQPFVAVAVADQFPQRRPRCRTYCLPAFRSFLVYELVGVRGIAVPMSETPGHFLRAGLAVDEQTRHSQTCC